MDTTNTNASAIAGKPETITAAQFISEGYADKIKRGKCEVLSHYGVKISLMSLQSDYGDLYACIGTYEGEIFPTAYDGLDKFTVTWLPAATASPAPTGEGGAEDGVTIICVDEEPVDYGSAEYWRMLYDAEQYKMFRATRALEVLQQQNAALASELEAARGQVAGLVKALEALRDDPEAKVAKDFDVFMATQERDVKLAVRLAVYDTKYQISQSAKAALEAAQALTASE